MRFAIWAAVSTAAQSAQDKVSLTEQEDRSRQVGLDRAWQETAGPFIVPGESRTRWVNLRDAEEHIPALKQMLNAAQLGSFDVLILYDYTRLRELLEPVAKTLSAYGVQIFSVSQPVEPLAPDQYDSNETASTLQFVAGFTSRAEISAFRRRYKLGMPRRISEKGLPSGTIPFGFRKPPGRETDRKAIPVTDPIKSEVVIKIKDMFLAGRSLWQIADYLTDHHISTPRGNRTWTDVSVRAILKHKFYAGEVSIGRTRRTVDPRTGQVKIIKSPPGRVTVGKGAHQPLWNESVARAIEEEFARRGKKYAGVRTQRLSHLLYCGVCGARCWVRYPGAYSEKGRRWACSVHPAHVNLFDRDLLPAFAKKLEQKIKEVQNIKLPLPEDRSQAKALELTELKNRLTRIHDAFEAGVMEFSEYASRSDALKAQIKQAEQELQDTSSIATRHANRLAIIGGLAGLIKESPSYIFKAPAQDVNAQLRSIIEKIIITPADIDIHLIE